VRKLLGASSPKRKDAPTTPKRKGGKR
jgi:hypothetical protein